MDPINAHAYRPDIDGLRAIAVMSVVVHHFAHELLPGGYVGVDVFFVISGYLITRIVAGELASGQFSFLRFYERRARRIFPALFAMLGATMVVGYAVLLPSDYELTLQAVLATLLFASNILFWRQQGGYFEATETALNPLLHTWSLGVEEQFYLLYPVVLLLCWPLGRKRLICLLLAGALVSLALAATFVQGKNSAVFYLAPFRAWELLAGALLALGVLPSVRRRWTSELMVGAGVAAIAAACLLYDELTVFPGGAALLPVAGAALVIHGGSGGGSRASAVLACRPLVYIGLLSYSLYLWHWPVLVFGRYLNGLSPFPGWAVPVLIATSVLLAAASHRWIERPWRGGRLRPRQVAVAAGSFAVLAAAVAVGGLVLNGFTNRFDPAIAQLDRARKPHIPYFDCAAREPQEACRIGDPNAVPDIALWGDSHMIAWAPALDANLREQGKSALLFVTTGCAPLIGADSLLSTACLPNADALKAHLEARPDLRTVVLSAFWSTYFREGGPMRSVQADPERSSVEAAQHGLVSTLGWLRSQGRRTVLIGPVPVFDRNVPAALALEQITGRELLESSLDEQREANAVFLQAVAQVTEGPLHTYVDPLEWLCGSDCQVEREGVPMYRDAHHLSLAGAMALRMELKEELAQD